MALRNSSLFLYGLEVTPTNQYITFGTTSLEVGSLARTAQLNLGFYSLTSLSVEVIRAFTAADPLHIYDCTTDRTIMGGLQNRVTITTNGGYLSIYFLTGNPSNPATLLGFNTADYTGATTYTGSASAGTAFVPNLTQSNTFVNGFTFLPTQAMQKNFGSVNVSASGLKEAIVFSIQFFWQVQFKYIMEATLQSDWYPLVQWMIQQRQLDFTPDVTQPNTYYNGTLDDPDQGLSFDFEEMLPEFPFQYSTPLMKFRQTNES
jgi:hypothetical protein